jgi:hypothetical protein
VYRPQVACTAIVVVCDEVAVTSMAPLVVAV